MRLSKKNSAGRSRLAPMPPTTAARWIDERRLQLAIEARRLFHAPQIVVAAAEPRHRGAPALAQRGGEPAAEKAGPAGDDNALAGPEIHKEKAAHDQRGRAQFTIVVT